ncbi:transcriptional regulator, AraC family [Pseudopedobacter saltans DSM 12145]|uniref:Transcriptional regulator, AraC family n=1 Tax=Pseudopedobacter saltans (strain ATCC 51119 / DSM 12145 / JCM 21818 / CCUG 39354 / LMG 10337 / NBRC 100064 / NCIMB 13643) TaxID=762903 RepID=F0S5A2_PSESL|nr:AraC family transcriptional regulator [Pseudopedobacter saltans]ADY52047.1 transcriptional regulator, AraC family [Pseudopedobacter saltans DSM 12145]
MKAQFHKVPTKLETSYNIRNDVSPNFGTVWHYHPELELHYVKKGEGVRFIGDNINNFSAGEMILLGENLPHTWRCKDEYFIPESNLNVEATVIQFLPNCLGQDFLNIPETYQIPRLFEKAKQGLIIKGKTKKKLEVLMHDALGAQSLQRITVLLNILSTLADSEEFEVITKSHTFYRTNNIDTERINKICTYTLSNYKEDISLEQIASLSNLSITSFCRYFKQITKKTYYDFLTEIRISHACRILVNNTLTVEAISMECGFNNPSNFYRHFKKVMGCTPIEYKTKFYK